MEYKLLDGKATAAQMKQEMAEEVAQIKAAGGKVPHLAAILVGHDGGSETYVASKVKTCGEIGFKSTLIRYEADVTEEELLRKVHELNEDDDVDGFIGTWTASTRLTSGACPSVCPASCRLLRQVSLSC